MAMRLNENPDDNGEMHDQRDAVYRRHAGSADYLYGGRAAGDGRREGQSAGLLQPAATATGKPIYLSVKADKSMFLGNDPVTEANMINARIA